MVRLRRACWAGLASTDGHRVARGLLSLGDLGNCGQEGLNVVPIGFTCAFDRGKLVAQPDRHGLKVAVGVFLTRHKAGLARPALEGQLP